MTWMTIPTMPLVEIEYTLANGHVYSKLVPYNPKNPLNVSVRFEGCDRLVRIAPINLDVVAEDVDMQYGRRHLNSLIAGIKDTSLFYFFALGYDTQEKDEKKRTIMQYFFAGNKPAGFKPGARLFERKAEYSPVWPFNTLTKGRVIDEVIKAHLEGLVQVRPFVRDSLEACMPYLEGRKERF